jgi:cytochrome c oxidase subunit 3/cytochrome c oxidase subunit I+III
VSGAAARAEQRRLAMPNGWWGVALFIAAEATLFGTLFATYFYLRFNAQRWPPPGVPDPKVALPLVLTGILVATTIPVFLGARAARAGDARATWLFFLVALLIQGGYFGVQVHEFLSDLDKFSPHGSAYASIYFTLLGAHHAHVVVGKLLELWVLWKLLGGFTTYRLVGVRVASFYWYFVNLTAIAVVLTQVYPAL